MDELQKQYEEEKWQRLIKKAQELAEKNGGDNEKPVNIKKTSKRPRARKKKSESKKSSHYQHDGGFKPNPENWPRNSLIYNYEEYFGEPTHIKFAIDKKLFKTTTAILRYYSKLYRQITGFRPQTINGNERRLLASLIEKKGKKNVLVAITNMMLRFKKQKNPFNGKKKLKPTIANFVLYYDEFRNDDELVELNLNEILGET